MTHRSALRARLAGHMSLRAPRLVQYPQLLTLPRKRLLWLWRRSRHSLSLSAGLASRRRHRRLNNSQFRKLAKLSPRQCSSQLMRRNSIWLTIFSSLNVRHLVHLHLQGLRRLQ